MHQNHFQSLLFSLLISDFFFPMRGQVFCQLFLMLLLFICCRMNDVAAEANSSKCRDDHKMQLLLLKDNITYDPEVSTKLITWDERIDCCKWEGVTCNDAGHVIGLDLSSESFSGSINPLANLMDLSVVIIDGNNLSASIPDFFADLSNLTVLRLRSCGLTGEIPPNIFRVPTLQEIDLAYNGMLGGSLPEFPSTGSLQRLELFATNVSGTLPKSIGNLRMLSYLDLRACDFTGPLPSSMENLTQLAFLDLSRNNFTGSLPSFRVSKNLSYISFGHNKLSGESLSSHWDTLEKLESLDLSHNSLSGPVPASLFSLPSLKELDLSHNTFSGEITKLAQNVTSPLTYLELSDNNLNGTLPEFFFELKDVSYLSLSSNDFNGTVKLDKFTKLKYLSTLDLSASGLSVDTNISKLHLALLPQFSILMLPSCNLQNISFLKNQSRLMFLDLSDNHIKGAIPNWIWEISNRSLRILNLSLNQFTHFQEPYRFPGYPLNILDLHSNLLSGEIPLPPRSAKFLDLSSNKFATSIPPDLGDSLSRTCWFLSLANNRITGIIPSSICNADLRVLDLSNNNLTGRVPTCLAEKTSGLKVMSLGGNSLRGNMPGNFSEECSLETLDLSRNLLEGRIPQSLSNCRNLKVLNVGNNKLSDTFPCWLSNLSNLRVLALRFNDFHGNINCPGVNVSWPALQIIDLASNNFSGVLPRNFFVKLKTMMLDSAVAYSRPDHLRQLEN